jgi:probable F420-dependent oxidoreductase
MSGSESVTEERSTMKLGIAIPQTDIGGDPLAARDFAQAAEAIGYHHLATYDHVLGASVTSRPGWTGAYTSEHCFHDTFVLFGYLTGQTTGIEFTTHVLILPQRQTALVAKQAASVDVLSGGRLRLGVGIGWNPVEYVDLGENFHNRGRRSEEQVAVMKALWADPHVTFKGAWHDIPDAGINPLPVRRSIPVWFGGHADPVLRRIARLGDGWIMLTYQPDKAARQEIEKLRAYAREVGRTKDDIGIDAWMSMGGRTPEEWRQEVEAWRHLGVTHITLNTAFERRHHKRIDGRSTDSHITSMRHFHASVANLLY